MFVFLVGVFMVLPMVSAGVGISWDRESALVPENTKTCLTYKVYNPWDSDTNVQIVLSDTLQEIVSSQESENKFIPAQTSSSNAIPVTFCFKTPRVYDADCLIGGGNGVICKQECTEDRKVFEGEVEIKEVNDADLEGAGAGGSKTSISVSAPLRVRVQCVEHGRNYSLVYLFVGIVAAVLLSLNLLKSSKKKDSKKKGNSKNKKRKK
jgi:hypothetical protein